MVDSRDAQTNSGWRLRQAGLGDVDGLHALTSKPPVYRYLFDGAAPDEADISHRIAQSTANPAEMGFGMWILEASGVGYAGCVELKPYPSPRSAELTYLLDPDRWGQGLATRMAWTAVAQAFSLSAIDVVIAGADRPNDRSFGVMRRLGMRFHRHVQYPLGTGSEYIVSRADRGPVPKPALIPLG